MYKGEINMYNDFAFIYDELMADIDYERMVFIYKRYI